MKKQYKYLIVGAGLFGATLAYRLKMMGESVLVIDERSHIGGNVYTEYKNNIYIHKYGPHIFHTSNNQVWSFIKQFDDFEQFQYQPIAIYKDQIYNLPFNMHTFYKMFGWTHINDAKEYFEKTSQSPCKNVEEFAIQNVGEEVYEKLIKGYTEKQWGTPCNLLSPEIIKRLPVRFEWNNNYFNDEYQGIPKHGYTYIIEKMLDGIDVELNEKFDILKYYDNFEKIFYCGSIDELCDYKFGILPYRSLKFRETENEESQGIPVINYTELEIPWTRRIDHKMFLRSTKNLQNTIMTYEYPCEWEFGLCRYYPIPLKLNIDLYNKYKDYIGKKYPKIIPCGRLGEYKYLNMDQVIKLALNIKI